MSEKSNIAWTDASWNPVTGCSRVSEGCRHCYAETLSLRFGWSKKPWTAQNAAENVVLHPGRLGQPLRWRKPRRVFVNSMSDLFHELVPDEFIDQVFAVMALAPQHSFLILTKRPQRMRDYAADGDLRVPRLAVAAQTMKWAGTVLAAEFPLVWPLPNCWLGVSVEDQATADQRIPILLASSAAIRFVSCEPLLGAVDLQRFMCSNWPYHESDPDHQCIDGYQHRLDWVIVGGESGANFRPMNLDWARSLVAQCRHRAGVAVFFKQASGLRPGMPSGDKELDTAKEFP